MDGLWIEVKICFSSEEYEQLKALARVRNHTVSSFIQNLVRGQLNRQPNL